MKKIILLLCMLVGVLTTQAADYNYLTFETTDGAKVSVSVSGLTVSISGTTLTVGSQSFALSNLSKMYFSTSDETTGIEPITRASLDEAIAIYDLQGHQVTKEQIQKGIYVVKTKQSNYKMVVR